MIVSQRFSKSIFMLCLASIAVFLFTNCASNSNKDLNGAIISKVVDKHTKEPLYGVRATLLQNGKTTARGSVTDISGGFVISEVPPGIYDIQFTYHDYGWQFVRGVVVKPSGKIILPPVELIAKRFLPDTVFTGSI